MFYFKFSNQKKFELISEKKHREMKKINSNIIKDVNYTSKDTDGNEYIINAIEGEIDLSNH